MNIYIYYFAVNLKRYTSIRNISYRWLNRYSLQYGIDSLVSNIIISRFYYNLENFSFINIFSMV